MIQLRRGLAVTLTLSLLLLTAQPAIVAAEADHAAAAPAPVSLGALSLASAPGSVAAPRLDAAPADLSAAGLPSLLIGGEAAASEGQAAAGSSALAAQSHPSLGAAPSGGAPSALTAAELPRARTQKTAGRLSTPAGLTWSTLRWVFDGRPEIIKPAPGESPALPVSGDHVKLLLIQQGREPAAITLTQLRETLAKDADFKARFNAAGHLRLVLDETPAAGELAEKDGSALVGALEQAGLSVDVHRARIERLSTVKRASAPEAPASPWKTRAIRAAAGIAGGAAFVAALGLNTWMAAVFVGLAASQADRIPGQIVYLVRTLKASFKESKRPTIFEWINGLGWKIPPFLINVFMVYAGTYKGHPLAYAAVVALSFGLDFFHGVLIDTWNTLQGKLESQRGMGYQGAFNFLYGQFWGVVFRGIAWAAIAGTTAPWLNAYWAPTIVMALVGMIFGTLGWSGLNSLYQKGAISRGTRSLIQGLRDGFFMVVGAYFATGNLHSTIYLFAAQQAIDFALYLWNRRTPTRPLVYAADARLAGTPEFANGYPPRPAVTFTQALKNLQYSPYVKPFVSAYHWLVSRFQRRG